MTNRPLFLPHVSPLLRIVPLSLTSLVMLHTCLQSKSIGKALTLLSSHLPHNYSLPSVNVIVISWCFPTTFVLCLNIFVNWLDALCFDCVLLFKIQFILVLYVIEFLIWQEFNLLFCHFLLFGIWNWTKKHTKNEKKQSNCAEHSIASLKKFFPDYLVLFSLIFVS